MLVGGVESAMDGKSKRRGDIHVAVVGDPSMGKSQMLMWVKQHGQKNVYTCGKGVSAAGLTASVVRDADTGVAAIEPGALLLADGGVCCIDEFEKMSQKDMVAIHEAMEQQTVTITKAGAHSRFHARASVLAAMNPVRINTLGAAVK